MAESRVRMKHPDIQGLSGLVAQRAFDEVWEAKGWTVVDPAVAVAAETLGTEVKSLGALTKSELEEVATMHGLDTSTLGTKAELIQAIETVAPAT